MSHCLVPVVDFQKKRQFTLYFMKKDIMRWLTDALDSSAYLRNRSSRSRSRAKNLRRPLYAAGHGSQIPEKAPKKIGRKDIIAASKTRVSSKDRDRRAGLHQFHLQPGAPLFITQATAQSRQVVPSAKTWEREKGTHRVCQRKRDRAAPYRPCTGAAVVMPSAICLKSLASGRAGILYQ